MTGLSIDTLRAWERRYQAVTPMRGERGRCYSEGQIQRLILLRDAVASGHAIGQVAGLGDGELKRLLLVPAKIANAQVPGRIEPPSSDALVPIVAAIESFDYAAANFHLGRLAVLLPVDKLVGEVVFPLMQLVGERWQHGTLTIAQEHMTSSILRNLLGGLVRLSTSSTPSQRILFATPSGELHEFGILAAAMLAYFGTFDARSIPFSWESTENALEKSLFSTNSVVSVVDVLWL